MSRAALGLVALALAGGRAQAAELDLRVRAPVAGTPGTLAMRSSTAAAAPAAAAPGPPRASAPPSLIDRFASIPSDIEELADQVIFRFQVGVDLEQGQLSGLPMGSGQPVPEGNRNTRLVSVGDVALGSRGLLVPPLSTYLAAHFRFDQDRAGGTTSSPSIYDAAPRGAALLVRSAYAELGDFGATSKLLAPLRVRAGRQFRYGMAVLHFDGASAWYDGARVSASAFVGRRVSLYREDLRAEDIPTLTGAPAVGPIGGATLDVRLLQRGVRALVLGAEALGWEGHRFGQGTLRWQLTPDAALSSFVRLADGRLARWGAGVRARLSKTSTVSLDGEHRRVDDWAYDLIVRGHDARAGSDSQFLFLGPSVPELRLAGRAGTVLLDNLDLLASVAAATPGSELTSPWAPPYLELGLAADGRFASGLSLALSVRARRYFRPSPPEPAEGQGAPERFHDAGALGETSFYEGGTRLRYAVGRKRFAADFEGFIRLVEDRHLERPPQSRLPYDEVDIGDVQAGARFRVEAWVGARARLLGEYEVGGTPVEITELRGLQILRLLGEVSF